MKPLPEDPHPGTWKTLPPLQTARSHPAVAVHGGKIYVIGGGGPNFQSLDSVEIYDPREGRWTLGAAMPTRRSGTATATIGDKIYVIGGGYKKPDGRFQFLKTVEILDLANDTWSKGQDLLMPHDYPAFAQAGESVFIFGGHHPDATEGGPQTDPGFAFSERLHLLSGGWREIAPVPVPRFAKSAVVLDGNVWVTGGVAYTGQGLTEYGRVDILDPVSERWMVEEGLELPWPMAAHAASAWNGRLYCFGGFSTDWINARCVAYDPSRKAWTRLPDLHKPRAAMGTALLAGAFYLIGGWERDGRSVMNDVAVYSPGRS